MLLAIAFLCFIGQVVAWMLLPSSTATEVEETVAGFEISDAPAA